MKYGAEHTRIARACVCGFEDSSDSLRNAQSLLLCLYFTTSYYYGGSLTPLDVTSLCAS